MESLRHSSEFRLDVPRCIISAQDLAPSSFLLGLPPQMPLGTSFAPFLLLLLLAFRPSTSLLSSPLQRPKQTKFPKMVSLLLLRSLHPSLHLRRRRRRTLEGGESKKEEGDTLSLPVVRSVPRPKV